MIIDAIDRKIITALQKDGRIRITELAEQVGLSPTPCARRVALLEDAKIITGYVAQVDQAALGLPISVFVSIELETQMAAPLRNFEEHIERFEEVMECYLMTGSQDFLMRIVAADLASYERFLQEKLTKVAGIRSIRSHFALRPLVRRTSLPLRAIPVTKEE